MTGERELDPALAFSGNIDKEHRAAQVALQIPVIGTSYFAVVV